MSSVLPMGRLFPLWSDVSVVLPSSITGLPLWGKRVRLATDDPGAPVRRPLGAIAAKLAPVAVMSEGCSVGLRSTIVPLIRLSPCEVAEPGVNPAKDRICGPEFPSRMVFRRVRLPKLLLELMLMPPAAGPSGTSVAVFPVIVQLSTVRTVSSARIPPPRRARLSKKVLLRIVSELKKGPLVLPAPVTPIAPPLLPASLLTKVESSTVALTRLLLSPASMPIAPPTGKSRTPGVSSKTGAELLTKSELVTERLATMLPPMPMGKAWAKMAPPPFPP